MNDQLHEDTGTKLESAITAWKTQAAETRDELTAHITKVKDSFEAILTDIVSRTDASLGLSEAVTTELQAVQQSLRDHDTVVKDGERRVSELESALAEQKNASESDKERIVQLEKDVAEGADAIQAARRRVGELETNLADQESAVTAANDRAAKLEQSESAVRQELETLRADLEERQASEERTASELTAARAEVENLRAELESLRPLVEQLGEAEKELQAERRHAQLLQEQLIDETAKGTKATIAEQLAEALRDVEAGRVETAALRERIAELESGRGDADADTQSPTEHNGITPKKTESHREGRTSRMGEMLLEAGIISRAQLDGVLEAQRKYPQVSLAKLLVDNGYASEEMVAQAMACQREVLFMHLNEETVDPAAAQLISRRIAEQHSCIPISAIEDTLVLAMVDPLDLVAI